MRPLPEREVTTIDALKGLPLIELAYAVDLILRGEIGIQKEEGKVPSDVGSCH